MEVDNYLSQSVDYNATDNSISVGSTIYDNWGGWWPEYEKTVIKEYYPAYWPNYVTTTIPSPSKLEQAFKIVSKLIEKKIITKKLEVKDFVELVNQVSDVI